MAIGTKIAKFFGGLVFLCLLIAVGWVVYIWFIKDHELVQKARDAAKPTDYKERCDVEYNSELPVRQELDCGCQRIPTRLQLSSNMNTAGLFCNKNTKLYECGMVRQISTTHIFRDPVDSVQLTMGYRFFTEKEFNRGFDGTRSFIAYMTDEVVKRPGCAGFVVMLIDGSQVAFDYSTRDLDSSKPSFVPADHYGLVIFKSQIPAESKWEKIEWADPRNPAMGDYEILSSHYVNQFGHGDAMGIYEKQLKSTHPLTFADTGAGDPCALPESYIEYKTKPENTPDALYDPNKSQKQT